MTFTTTQRNLSIERGLRLQGLTIGWMIVEASVSVAAGIAASSLLLIAFGTDSVIEIISAGVVYWRLRTESSLATPDERSPERLERRSAQVAGYLLWALGAFVFVEAIYGLAHRHSAGDSWPGMVVALIAAIGMPALAKAKVHIAEEIGSQALRADAIESITCGYLSWVLLTGLIANAMLHWWWLDSAASLVIVPFIVKEAREAVSGECSCR